MESIFITESPSRTRKMGELLIKETIKIPAGKRAFILGLAGDLGSGKTTFLQGFAKGLGIKEKILSPTFIIMRRMEISECIGPSKRKSGRNLRLERKIKSGFLKFQNFYHIDCYRIRKTKEILSLGFKEITQNPKNIIAVEWADRIKKIMPKQTLWIDFNFVGKNKRKILIKKCLGENY